MKINNFKQYLIENTNFPEIQINIETFKKEIKQEISDSIDNVKEKERRLKSFKLDIDYIKKHLENYPDKESFIKNLNTPKNLYREYKKYFEWNSRGKNYEDELRFRTYIFDYIDKLNGFNASEIISYYIKEYKKIIYSTIENCKILKDKIKNAIKNLDWSTKKNNN